MSELIRNTAYLHLYENKRQVRSIGYLKRNRRDQEDRLIIHIGGFYTEGIVTGRIYTIFEEGDHYMAKELGEITISQNQGDARFLLSKDLEDHIGVAVIIQGKSCISWYDGSVNAPEIYYPEMKEGADFIKISEDNQQQSSRIEVDKGNKEHRQEPVTSQEQKISQEQETLQEENEPIEQPNDIWMRLAGIFPMVYPFEYPVEAEYLSVTPQELRQLPESEHVLIQNSFLQHAYYQYKYIILGKKNDTYYVGVPGIYHEREIMMAKMFGFKNFLCAKKEQPVQGCFGYYMKEILVDAA